MICACCWQHICNKFGGDRGSAFSSLVLPCIREAWNNCGNPACWNNLAGINHDQKLHQIVTDFATATLHYVDILSLHTLANFHAGLLVAEFRGHTALPNSRPNRSAIFWDKSWWELPLKILIFGFLVNCSRLFASIDHVGSWDRNKSQTADYARSHLGHQILWTLY